MDMQLYKRVQDVVDGLSKMEEQQNQKLDEVLAQLAELKQLFEVAPKAAEVKAEPKPKAQELPKPKVKK